MDIKDVSQLADGFELQTYSDAQFKVILQLQ